MRNQLIQIAGQFSLIDESENEKQKHVTFFIHGYNNTWTEAVQRYRKLRRTSTPCFTSALWWQTMSITACFKTPSRRTATARSWPTSATASARSTPAGTTSRLAQIPSPGFDGKRSTAFAFKPFVNPAIQKRL